MATSTSRFASTSCTEAAKIRSNLHSKETVKANKTAAQTLKSYLREQGRSPNFENLPPGNLNDVWR